MFVNKLPLYFYTTLAIFNELGKWPVCMNFFTTLAKGPDEISTIFKFFFSRIYGLVTKYIFQTRIYYVYFYCWCFSPIKRITFRLTFVQRGTRKQRIRNFLPIDEHCSLSKLHITWSWSYTTLSKINYFFFKLDCDLEWEFQWLLTLSSVYYFSCRFNQLWQYFSLDSQI